MNKKLSKFLVLLGTIACLASCGGGGTENNGEGGKENDPVNPDPEPEYNPMHGSIFAQTADYSDRNGKYRDWDKVSSYFINYGSFQEEMLKYDVGICGRDAMKPEDMVKFKNSGTYTLCYITFGEDYSLNIGDGLGPSGYASYYLYDEAGQPIPNGDWGSYYVDPASPGWTQIVMNEVQRIVDFGFDGIFMDTIDSVYVFPETLSPMAQLIHKVRVAFPDIKIVLNRGFKIIPTIYNDLDGCLFELFSTAYDTTHFVYDKLDFEKSVTFTYNRLDAVNIINAVRQVKYFPVFAMEYYPDNQHGGNDLDRQAIYNNDWLYDFIPYINSAGREIGGAMMPYSFRPTNQTMRGSKALLAKDPTNLPKNGDVSAKNLAYGENGTKVTVDSLFNGYSSTVLTDGYISTQENFADLGWAYANWASSEADVDHWIQLEFDSPKTVSTFKVYWAYDNGEIYSSRNITIEAYIDDAWVVVGSALDIDNNTPLSVISLEGATNITKIRLYQRAGQGPKTGGRDRLCWVSEVQCYA